MTTVHQDLSKLNHEQLLALAMSQQTQLQASQNKGTVIKVYGKGVTRKGPDGKPVVGKGNVAVYGLQRMPVTLYPPQWLRLLDMADDIRATIEANKAILSWDKNDA